LDYQYSSTQTQSIKMSYVETQEHRDQHACAIRAGSHLRPCYALRKSARQRPGSKSAGLHIRRAATSASLFHSATHVVIRNTPKASVPDTVLTHCPFCAVRIDSIVGAAS
jgi:hypothetical protein